jgi:hypothetical protein
MSFGRFAKQLFVKREKCCRAAGNGAALVAFFLLHRGNFDIAVWPGIRENRR